MNRRNFIKSSVLAAIFLKVGKLFPAKIGYDDEIKKVKDFISGLDYSLKSETTSDLIKYIGSKFIGTPYEAGTLDINDNEELVIHISGLDCVTFVENVLTFMKMIRSEESDIKDYTNELMNIRYRNGRIDDYTSRLHYFSDWIYENEKKSLVKNITQEIGGEEYNKEINFMTTHKDSYPSLKNNPEFLERMKQIEADISSRIMYYIRKENISNFYSNLQTGDIFAVTTEIKGLDVTHTGFIYKLNDKTHILHASQAVGEVVISKNTIKEYLSSIKKSTGLMIAIPI